MLKSANLGVRFILEILALVSLGYWGFSTGRGWLVKTLLRFGAPLIAAVLWANFGAPAAAQQLRMPLQFGLEFLIFGSATAGLILADQKPLGILYGALFVMNEILLLFWKQ